MKNNKGFTVVELLAAFTLTMVIVVFLFEIVLELKNVYVDSSLKTSVISKNSVVATTLNNYFKRQDISSVSCFSNTCNVGSSNITIGSNDITIGDQVISMPTEPKPVEISKPIMENGCVSVSSKYNCYIKVSYSVDSDYLEKEIPFNYIYTYSG
ncbi:MAG: prepilin-type N-terminal cleavage/methylation domain-containing protein [Bacilli bacterium]|nr:prepilin-type N-terminal cleavage/methylation domain-containing protein [Bacilli bacterium]